MSASIAPTVGSAYQNYRTDSSNEQFKKDMQSIQTALQSGDLSGAQDAFSKLQELQQQKTSKSGSGKNDGSNQGQQDMQALQSALSSGNLQDAQSAFSKLQTDMKAHGGHHRHHQATDASTQSTATVDTRTGASPARYA